MVGKVEPSHVDFATALLKRLPERLSVQLREPVGAASAIIALLLAGKESVDAYGKRISAAHDGQSAGSGRFLS
jgi:hypothetical protein